MQSHTRRAIAYFVTWQASGVRELWGKDGRLLALNQQTMVLIK